MQRKLTLLLSLFLLAGQFLLAQVTTSSISGTVAGPQNDPLVGATITAVHQPTGTIYRTSSLTKGVYNIPNMIPGGPYRVEVSFVGYQNFVQENITLALGENTRVDVPLSTTAGTLQEVVVTGTSGANRRKTGASTNIGRQQIERLPTLSRSLQDCTRLTPQANGNSFGGANNRFNNITIDGAVNNDVFGLSGSGTPGGQAGTQPISLDAIQEIQVVLAPYDITYGNFTGGGVNAVTRSGTNKVDGSVYYFVRNQNTIGSDPITKAKSGTFSDKQYGFRVGGPIIKNKLFFFLNGEQTRRTAPTIFNADDQGAVLTSQEAQTLSSFLNTTYKYDPGTFGVFDAQTQSDKLFARLDWNISEKHRLTLRHNFIDASDDNISRSGTSFRFGNNGYRFNNNQNITVMELRSRFTNRVSNNLILGKHRIRDFRSTFGQPFPSVEITVGAGTVFLGSERSSTANELDQDIFEITDNLRITRGKHTITVGTHNEFFQFRNLFINNLNGRWRFRSLQDFYNNNPNQLEATWSNVAGTARPAARFNAAQLSFYAQDEIQFNRQFRLNFGLRADLPVVSDQPGFNPIVDSTFKGQYSTSFIPERQLLWSPRVGFNYDVEGNRNVIVRGGVGVFTGRIPFVWVSNQFSNTGLLLNSYFQTDAPATPANEVNAGLGFNPDVNAVPGLNANSRNFEVNLINRNFKFPQVFRVNLATDLRLPGGVLATFEGIYSKTLNNIVYADVNLVDPTGLVDPAFNNGADQRIAFPPSSTARRRNPAITNAILLSNTDRGYSYNLTAQFSRTWKNVFAQVAYNHNNAADVNSGTSSTARSNWEFVQVVGNPNTPPLAISNFALPHRITAVLSTNFEYAKNFRTSLAFFYAGNSGSRFTYLVNGDLNQDGGFGNDLLYVPRNGNEIRFVDFLNPNGTVRFTAAQQAEAFQAFIDNDKYLSKRRGQYTERNAASTPWEHVLDMRIAQDFFVGRGQNRHTLQVTFDVFNFTNLLNRGWGRQWAVTNQAYNLLTTVTRGIAPTQEKGYTFNIGQTPWNPTFASRFQGQLGLRYSFN